MFHLKLRPLWSGLPATDLNYDVLPNFSAVLDNGDLFDSLQINIASIRK